MSGAIPLLPLCPYVPSWHGQGELYFFTLQYMTTNNEYARYSPEVRLTTFL